MQASDTCGVRKTGLKTIKKQNHASPSLPNTTVQLSLPHHSRRLDICLWGLKEMHSPRIDIRPVWKIGNNYENGIASEHLNPRFSFLLREPCQPGLHPSGWKTRRFIDGETDHCFFCVCVCICIHTCVHVHMVHMCICVLRTYCMPNRYTKYYLI